MEDIRIKTKKVCDMCGKDASHFINGNGDKFTEVMGHIKTQGKIYPKEIKINITASIPHHPSNYICTNCLKDALKGIISEIDSW